LTPLWREGSPERCAELGRSDFLGLGHHPAARRGGAPIARAFRVSQAVV